MDDRPGPRIAPLSFALGVAVLLVGLVVDPLVIAPLGGAITLVSGFVWAHRGDATRVPAVAAAEQVADERYSRSRLLERATLGIGGLVALAVTLPAAGFALLPSFLGGKQRPVDLGPIAAFPDGEFVVATFLADRQAGEVSRHAVYVRSNGPLGIAPSFTIMSSRCTHVGCPTQPNGPAFPQQRRSEHTSAGEVGLVPTQPSGFGCPCHGSQFDNVGNRTAGPAPRALDRYEFSIRNDHLVLGRLYSVSRVDGTGARARIHSYTLKGAGEPAAGPEAWLYPLDPSS